MALRQSLPTRSVPGESGGRSDFIGRFIDDRRDLYRNTHRALFDHWQACRPAPDRLPGRRDIDTGAIPDLMRLIWMTDIVPGDQGLRFRERLVGTGMVALYGFETTGRWFEEIYEGLHLARQIATYRAVATAARPHLSRLGVPRVNRESLVYDRLILPLADDGEHPDILLGIHAYEPEPTEDPAIWPAPDVTYPADGSARPFAAPARREP